MMNRVLKRTEFYSYVFQNHQPSKFTVDEQLTETLEERQLRERQD